MDTDSMTVKELKQELKTRGLKVSGNKAELIERLNEAVEHEAISTTNHNMNNDHHDTTIADFEEYINDEFKRLNNTGNVAEIDDIINQHDNDEQPDADAQEHDDEKDELLAATATAADFDSAANDSQTKIISDFDDEVTATAATATASTVALASDDSNALNHKSKVQDRINRFGAESYTASADKLESRKRRFAAMQNQDDNGKCSPPPAKKQRVDVELERQKMVERAKKFGTALPKNIKLTQEECAVVYKTQIERAKRFGTEHLLPSTVISAEMDAKKAERMKRFNTNARGRMVDADGNELVAESQKASKSENAEIIKADNEATSSTKLMERKLRFGTLEKRDGGEMKKKPLNGKQKAGGFKKNTPRQARNDQRIQRFRQYKKDNRQSGNYRGGRGGFGAGRGYQSNRGGYGSRAQSGGRGRGRGYGGEFRRGQQQQTAVNFSGADQEKINQRKMRFNQVSDF